MTTLTDVPPAASTPKFLMRLRGLTERRAFWVLMDQAIVSAGNFLTIRYLGIYLIKQDFGNYNVLLETINYLNSLQAALIIYPLTIRGATTTARALQRFATGSILFTLLLLPILGVAIFVAAGKMVAWQIAPAAVAALLLWQLQETMRRGLMSNLRFAGAVWGDAVSYLGQAAAIILVGRAGKLDLLHVFIIMAITSAGGMAIQAAQIGLRRLNYRILLAMMASFWKLGKWMLPNNASSLITSLGYWYTVRYYSGADATALFGATVLFFKPANPVQSSMGSLIVPAVARAGKEGGAKAARRQALRYIGFGAALLAPYFALLAIAPNWCIEKAYRTNAASYADVAPLLRLYVANYTCVYFSNTLGAWLAGQGKSRLSFYAQIVNIVATLAVGLPLTAKYGVMGLIIGGLVASVACTLACAWFIRQEPAARDSQPAGQVLSDRAESSVVASGDVAERLEAATQQRPQPVAPTPTWVLPPRPKLPPRQRRRR